MDGNVLWLISCSCWDVGYSGILFHDWWWKASIDCRPVSCRRGLCATICTPCILPGMVWKNSFNLVMITNITFWNLTYYMCVGLMAGILSWSPIAHTKAVSVSDCYLFWHLGIPISDSSYGKVCMTVSEHILLMLWFRHFDPLILLTKLKLSSQNIEDSFCE